MVYGSPFHLPREDALRTEEKKEFDFSFHLRVS